MRRSLLIPGTLTVTGIGLLCALGTWQLQRLQWKEALLAEINAPEHAARALSASDLVPERQYQKGVLTGHFLNVAPLRVLPRVYESDVGAHLIAPFQLTSGALVLVNRGWTPQDISPALPESGAAIAITGMIRTPERASVFTPANNPAANQWYFMDILAMQTALGTPELAPVIFYAVQETPPPREAYPIPQGDHLQIHNNHLQYALFWFSMAGVLAAIFALRFLTKKPD